jgi:hypothetical protein
VAVHFGLEWGLASYDFGILDLLTRLGLYSLVVLQRAEKLVLILGIPLRCSLPPQESGVLARARHVSAA